MTKHYKHKHYTLLRKGGAGAYCDSCHVTTPYKLTF